MKERARRVPSCKGEHSTKSGLEHAVRECGLGWSGCESVPLTCFWKRSGETSAFIKEANSVITSAAVIVWKVTCKDTKMQTILLKIQVNICVSDARPPSFSVSDEKKMELLCYECSIFVTACFCYMFCSRCFMSSSDANRGSVLMTICSSRLVSSSQRYSRRLDLIGCDTASLR